MLCKERLEQILAAAPSLHIGVLGDLFLDRYLDLDARLTEPSLETGLDAYQVVRVRSYPGAAGTVLNNLSALGVGNLHPLAVIGDDGEGYELRQALAGLRGVDASGVFSDPARRTPTYTKPMLCAPGAAPRELNRLDIKNRQPLGRAWEERLLAALSNIWPRLDALLVLDQVSEPECGAVTTRVRQRLQELGDAQPTKLILADSRVRIGEFRSLWLKPNSKECTEATGTEDTLAAARLLSARCGRPVLCTWGDKGIVVADAQRGSTSVIPAYAVSGPIDPVGAGDSTSAGIACAHGAGASVEEAAAFGNLVASITIQQLGTTGTANPDQVRARWRELAGG